ncbi:MAG: FAD-dependent oxidoreductase [Candidatus Thorarchaeota archaeon]
MTVDQPTQTTQVELENQVPSALVVGGGVAGMQAALDIANQGFKVHLVEKTSSIGGRMAAIDKTFPTLDCSACILTPRLSEVARHPNIELLTYSEIKRVTGRAGNFHIEVLRKPRYILEDKCSGCGDCVAVCPIETANEFDEGLGFRKATYIPFPQATPNVYTIDKRDHPACRVNCPAGVNCQAFVILTNQERYEDAIRIVRENIPFPATLGRVCVSWCEGQCQRGEYDGSVSIRNLHRFLADYEKETGAKPPVEAKIDKSEKVAVVGAGPAGVAAAYQLARLGYPVTVFEKRSEPGGLLKWAIPSYRLPRDILQEEIDWVSEHGVEFRMDSNVESVDQLTNEGYKAVFISTGASKSNKLMIPGEDSKNVFHAIDFLDKVASGENIQVGERVAVIGGGDAAVDSARTALRLGASEVTVIYRRSQVEIPAIPTEVEDARQEGIRFMFLTTPVEVVTQHGEVQGVKCIRMRLGEPDHSGRRRPLPIPDSDFTISADQMIIAVGQSVEPIPLHDGIETTEWGTLMVDQVTLQTSRKGVFAGGDCVLGPATVVQAISQGNEAAISIDRYLRSEDIRAGREPQHYRIAKPDVDPAKFKTQARAQMVKENIASRKGGFSEVERGFDIDTAISEAGRCLNCTVCCECKECVKACERDAIDHNMKEEKVDLHVGAIVVATGYKLFDVSRYRQLGYGKFPNVITAMEYERLINAAGPTQGNLIRFSDGKMPKSIGFVQCVGARDIQKGVPECSRVCCMYGIKNAVMAKEHDPDVDVSIYYADIRAFGKGFEEFYEMADMRFGVNFVRGRVGEVDENPYTHNLIAQVEDTETGALMKVEHDLLVISPGLIPNDDMIALANELGVTISDEGYIEVNNDLISPVDTSRDGIYVCGCADGPKDIPDSVTAGSAAAMRASIILGEMLQEQKTSLERALVSASEVEVKPSK